MISSDGVTVLWSGPLGGQADRLVPSGLRFRDSAGASAWPRFQAPGGSRRPVSSGSLSWNSGQQLGPLRGARGPQAGRGSILPPPQDAVVSRGAQSGNCRRGLSALAPGAGPRLPRTDPGPGAVDQALSQAWDPTRSLSLVTVWPRASGCTVPPRLPGYQAGRLGEAGDEGGSVSAVQTPALTRAALTSPASAPVCTRLEGRLPTPKTFVIIAWPPGTIF